MNIGAKTICACGRLISTRTFKLHARKCVTWLKAMAQKGHAVRLLDERSAKAKSDHPVVDPTLT